MFRPFTHAKRSSLLKHDNCSSSKARSGILVMPLTVYDNSSLLPMHFPSLEKNKTDFGAMSSWSVQPRLNHLLFAKACSHRDLEFPTAS
jgi:hypothetical protein